MIESFTKAAELSPVARDLSFAEARARYQGAVFAFVARRIRPVEDAEDVVAAVFVDAFPKWHKRRGDPKLWLFGIARRKMADLLRRRRPSWPLRETDLVGNSMDEFVNRTESLLASQILFRMPPDERDALTMSVVDGLTIDEIAEVLGRSAKATNSLLGRARSRVRRMTESTGDFR
ncbi:MAG: RNA polymerase sigma factor [Fimbriimonas sp.]|nr:RNA polymerase sigma factor [Fimbriimonas sp.]